MAKPVKAADIEITKEGRDARVKKAPAELRVSWRVSCTQRPTFRCGPGAQLAGHDGQRNIRTGESGLKDAQEKGHDIVSFKFGNNTGWPASPSGFLLRALVFLVFLDNGDVFFLGIVVWRREGPKPSFFFFIFFAFLLVSKGVSHSQRRVRSGLVVGHLQPSWRTRHPCTDVLPGPTGVTSSPGRDEIEAPSLLVFGWVEVFVGSRGEPVKSGVFLYTSVELQHPSSSKRVTSVGRLQHRLALEHPHQHSATAAMTIHHDSYSPLATPVVRSSDTIYSFHRGQNECNWNIALFACSCL